MASLWMAMSFSNARPWPPQGTVCFPAAQDECPEKFNFGTDYPPPPYLVGSRIMLPLTGWIPDYPPPYWVGSRIILPFTGLDI